MKIKTDYAEVEYSVNLNGVGIETTWDGTSRAKHGLEHSAGNDHHFLTATQIENAYLRSYDDIHNKFAQLLGDKQTVRKNGIHEILDEAIFSTLGKPWEAYDVYDNPNDYDPLWEEKTKHVLQALEKSGRKPMLPL